MRSAFASAAVCSPAPCGPAPRATHPECTRSSLDLAGTRRRWRTAAAGRCVARARGPRRGSAGVVVIIPSRASPPRAGHVRDGHRVHHVLPGHCLRLLRGRLPPRPALPLDALRGLAHHVSRPPHPRTSGHPPLSSFPSSMRSPVVHESEKAGFKHFSFVSFGFRVPLALWRSRSSRTCRSGCGTSDRSPR